MNDVATKRVLVSSGSPYEPIIGFSRAVRVGNIVAVGGTTAGSGGKPVAIGDPAAQTRAILEIIAKSLADAGASLKDVIRTRPISSTSPIGRRSAASKANSSAISAPRAACWKSRASSVRTGSSRSRPTPSCPVLPAKGR
jgi:enamine deaminase RidA (YjgF/YER057c/UK114 family)